VAPASDRWLNRALHAAAGVVIAVVAVEIFPEAVDVLSPWTVGVAFTIGGLATWRSMRSSIGWRVRHRRGCG
jgi:hypothetical protein